MERGKQQDGKEGETEGKEGLDKEREYWKVKGNNTEKEEKKKKKMTKIERKGTIKEKEEETCSKAEQKTVRQRGNKSVEGWNKLDRTRSEEEPERRGTRAGRGGETELRTGGHTMYPTK